MDEVYCKCGEEIPPNPYWFYQAGICYECAAIECDEFTEEDECLMQ